MFMGKSSSRSSSLVQVIGHTYTHKNGGNNHSGADQVHCGLGHIVVSDPQNQTTRNHQRAQKNKDERGHLGGKERLSLHWRGVYTILRHFFPSDRKGNDIPKPIVQIDRAVPCPRYLKSIGPLAPNPLGRAHRMGVRVESSSMRRRVEPTRCQRRCCALDKGVYPVSPSVPGPSFRARQPVGGWSGLGFRVVGGSRNHELCTRP
jgi:hypothetical protein